MCLRWKALDTSFYRLNIRTGVWDFMRLDSNFVLVGQVRNLILNRVSRMNPYLYAKAISLYDMIDNISRKYKGKNAGFTMPNPVDEVLYRDVSRKYVRLIP